VNWLPRRARTRFARRDALAELDPETDFHEIYRQLALYEFPWDINQALSFALFRTYAVPSIGRLLHRTGEFTRRVQKRYDDTGLLLEAVLEHGFDAEEGRSAIRRVNRMHRGYDISDDDMRYVLSTFVVTPIRWLDAYGWAGTWAFPTCPRRGASSPPCSTATRPRTSATTPGRARSPTPRSPCWRRSRRTTWPRVRRSTRSPAR
jgi:hypothetical protein